MDRFIGDGRPLVLVLLDLLVAQRLRRRKLRRMRKMPDSQWTKVRPHWICPTICSTVVWLSKAEIPDPRWWDGHPPSNGCWDGTPLIPCFSPWYLRRRSQPKQMLKPHYRLPVETPQRTP